MPSSKSWFRRRRPMSYDEDSSGRIDPFLNESALELGLGVAFRPRVTGADGRGGHLGIIEAPPPVWRETNEGQARSMRVDDDDRVDGPLVRERGEQREHASPEKGLDQGDGVLRAEPIERYRDRRSPTDDGPPAPARGEAKRDTIIPKFPRRDRTDNRPRFAFVTPGAPPGGPPLHDAFTPTRPQQEGGGFAGRTAELRRIITAIEEERAHILVYGERGSGRTSLANMLAAKASSAGYVVARLACGSAASFEDIVRAVLRQLPATLIQSPIGLAGEDIGRHLPVGTLEDQLRASGICIAELAGLLSAVRDRRALLILDDYDRVTSAAVRREIAEFAKILCDTGASLTLLLVGLADDVATLFGDDPSLQRTLVPVPIPPMSDDEVGAILTAGESKTGLRFDEPVRKSIVDLAQGLPYPAHLLALFAAHGAVRRQSRVIEVPDLRGALQRAGGDPASLLKATYDRALGDGSGATEREDLLFFAARCRTGATGLFDAGDIAAVAGEAGDRGAALSRLSLLSLNHALDGLTASERGAPLQRVSHSIEPAYRFGSGLMRAYVLIRQAEQRGLV